MDKERLSARARLFHQQEQPPLPSTPHALSNYKRILDCVRHEAQHVAKVWDGDVVMARPEQVIVRQKGVCQPLDPRRSGRVRIRRRPGVSVPGVLRGRKVVTWRSEEKCT